MIGFIVGSVAMIVIFASYMTFDYILIEKGVLEYNTTTGQKQFTKEFRNETK